MHAMGRISAQSAAHRIRDTPQPAAAARGIPLLQPMDAHALGEVIPLTFAWTATVVLGSVLSPLLFSSYGALSKTEQSYGACSCGAPLFLPIQRAPNM
jgi:hypothetical protein